EAESVGSAITRPQTAIFELLGARNQGTTTVVDEDLGVREPVLFAHPFSAEAHAGGSRALDHVCPYRSALDVIAFEKPGVSATAHHETKLPSQIVGILNAGIHSLTTGRRMNVGSIACNEHVTHAIL